MKFALPNCTQAFWTESAVGGLGGHENGSVKWLPNRSTCRKVEENPLGFSKHWNPLFFPGRACCVCCAAGQAFLRTSPFLWMAPPSSHDQPVATAAAPTAGLSVSSWWRHPRTARAGGRNLRSHRLLKQLKPQLPARPRGVEWGVWFPEATLPTLWRERKNHGEERQAEELELVVWVSPQPKRNHGALLLMVPPCVELWSWNSNSYDSGVWSCVQEETGGTPHSMCVVLVEKVCEAKVRKIRKWNGTFFFFFFLLDLAGFTISLLALPYSENSVFHL